jgi:hypothetical protein
MLFSKMLGAFPSAVRRIFPRFFSRRLRSLLERRNLDSPPKDCLKTTQPFVNVADAWFSSRAVSSARRADDEHFSRLSVAEQFSRRTDPVKRVVR